MTGTDIFANKQKSAYKPFNKTHTRPHLTDLQYNPITDNSSAAGLFWSSSYPKASGGSLGWQLDLCNEVSRILRACQSIKCEIQCEIAGLDSLTICFTTRFVYFQWIWIWENTSKLRCNWIISLVKDTNKGSRSTQWYHIILNKYRHQVHYLFFFFLGED